MENEQPEEYGEIGQLLECGSCGRKFAPQVLAKHAKICKKVFVDKRKAFNAAETRAATDASGKGLEEDAYSKKQRLAAAKKAETAEKKKDE